MSSRTNLKTADKCHCCTFGPSLLSTSSTSNGRPRRPQKEAPPTTPTTPTTPTATEAAAAGASTNVPSNNSRHWSTHLHQLRQHLEVKEGASGLKLWQILETLVLQWRSNESCDWIWLFWVDNHGKSAPCIVAPNHSTSSFGWTFYRLPYISLPTLTSMDFLRWKIPMDGESNHRGSVELVQGKVCCESIN